MTFVTPTRPAGVGPCAVGALLSCPSVSVFRWREQGKTCTHMWDVMRREGPGSVLFSTDGIQERGGRVAGGLRKGVCASVVWGRGRRGGLPQCLPPLSVNKWTPPPSQQRLGRRPRWQDTPLCLHIRTFYQSLHLRLRTLSVSVSFFLPLSTSVPSLPGKLPPVFVSPSRCDTPHSTDSYRLTSFPGSRTLTWQRWSPWLCKCLSVLCLLCSTKEDM